MGTVKETITETLLVLRSDWLKGVLKSLLSPSAPVRKTTVKIMRATCISLLTLFYFASSLRLHGLDGPVDPAVSSTMAVGESEDDTDLLLPSRYRLAKRYPLLSDYDEDMILGNPYLAREISRRSPQFAWRPHSRFGRR
ncbi:unnamed protein product [Hydatigera taeniaeformis]|uniref:Uncharacterized protein n=1 Tax=Hydatigena taeniaeformis TaxID=6205 RepID=A0A0R3WUM9_HYDTA|nr:unnamed protein product [Hydatigera taeniaeformis]